MGEGSFCSSDFLQLDWRVDFSIVAVDSIRTGVVFSKENRSFGEFVNGPKDKSPTNQSSISFLIRQEVSGIKEYDGGIG